MSDDLISRKALMVAINTDFYEHFTAHHDSDQTALIDMVMQDIEEIPTAYDVDAVCDNLRENAVKEISERNKHNLWIKNVSKWSLHNEKCSAYHKSIDIVRNGGKKE